MKTSFQTWMPVTGDIEIIPAQYRSQFLRPSDAPFMEKRVYTVRVVRVRDKGQEAFLATNLSREEFPKEAFSEMYSLRWGDKAAYRYINDRLQFRKFSGARTNLIVQDIFATVYISNAAEDCARDYATLKGLDIWYNDHVMSRMINRSVDIESLKDVIIYALLADKPEDKKAAMEAIYDTITNGISPDGWADPLDPSST